MSFHHNWDSEAFVVQAESRQELMQAGERLARYLAGAPDAQPKDLASTLNCELRDSAYRLAIVASSLPELREKLARALERLEDPERIRINDGSGTYYADEPLGHQGKLAFLFPGEGSQYQGMLADLCVRFPEARAWFDLIDRAFVGHPRGYLPSEVVFPPPGGEDGSSDTGDDARLWQMDCGPEAIFAANQALFDLLGRLDITPHAVVGHSTGEYSALFASGAQRIEGDDELIAGILELNRQYEELLAKDQVPEGLLVTVGGANRELVRSLVDESGGDLYLAMDNCPHQVVLCGSPETTAKTMEQLRASGFICTVLPFRRAYHTPLFQPFSDQLAGFFRGLTIVPPQVELYSCVTAQPYPRDPEEIRRLAAEHWARPVRFRETIEAMYDAGVRIFVEVGPRSNLTAFVDDILRGRPYLAVPSDSPQRSGTQQLNHLVAQLAAHGVSMRLDHLYAGRAPIRLSLGGGAEQSPEGGAEEGGSLNGSSGGMRLAMGLQPLRLTEDPGLRPGGEPPPGVAQEPRPSPSTLPAPRVTEAAATAEGEERRSQEAAPSLPQAPAPNPPSLPRDDPASGPRAVVMREYLSTMERFVDLQQDVTLAFLEGPGRTPYSAPPAGAGGDGSSHQDPRLPPRALQEGPGRPGASSPPRPERASPDPSGVTWEEDEGEGFWDPRQGQSEVPAGPSEEVRSLPFIGTVTSLIPGQELVARRRLDLDEDLFLRDHTLGRRVSLTDEGLLALPVVPLTISMEMLAEAAAALLPGSVVVGMREVHAHRWLALDESTLTLELTARRTDAASGQEVEVQIREVPDYRDAADAREASDSRDAEPRFAAASAEEPVVEGTVVLGSAYPEPPGAGGSRLDSAGPSTWTTDRLYEDLMFHGPSFQGVASVDRTGESGTVATLRALPTAGLFHSTASPRFLTDPVLLDATGQLVGYWTAERFESAFHVFPFRVEALHLYGPNLPAGERATCRAEIAPIGELQLRSDIDVIRSDGSLLARLVGWWDRRVDLPDAFYRLRTSPRDSVLSSPWPAALGPSQAPEAFACCLLADISEDLLHAQGRIWQRVLAHLVLSRHERAAWRRLKGSERRRTEWLLGRVAAKDAVRLFLDGRHGMRLCPADVEIAQDERGAPRAGGSWAEELEVTPAVSLAHCDGVALAIAGHDGSCRGVGIDVERLRPLGEEFEAGAFAPEERRLLSSLDPPSRQEWSVRLWCAKEAVGKALGGGMFGRPAGLVARGWDLPAGVVEIDLSEELAGELPELVGPPISAYTIREGDLVAATVVTERGL